MARRLFRGRKFSENGWPYVDQGSCKWFQVNGPEVTLQIQEGAPYAILGAFARDYHQHVEPIFDPDCACWTLDNSADTSNHPGGTACDLRWQSHPFKQRGTFTAAQLKTIQELMDFYEGTVFWAGVDWREKDGSVGGWGSPIDEMHWQMGYGTYDQANDRVQPWVNDFIARKIRADGFSTFRRGNAAQPNDAALILSRATGLDLNRATEILPTMQQGLREADCTTPLRIAMFIAQTGHESDDYNATEEYQNGPMDQERWIYKGRTWIQITWRSHYQEFGQWCYERGLVTDPNVFVNNPRKLADLEWAGIGAAWYWVETRRETRPYPTLNEASDARDLVTATQIVNGGTNGLEDRRLRYNRALAVGDDLTHILNGEDDFLMALSPDEQRLLLDRTNQIWGALFNEVDSLSPFAPPGQKIKTKDLIRYIDGSVHALVIKAGAEIGDTTSIDMIATAAARGVAWAQYALADLEANHPQILQSYLEQKGSRR